MKKVDNRILYFDVLRIISIFAVICVHVNAGLWWDYHPSINWYLTTIIMSLLRWCVPIFIMISGALFLNSNKRISIRKLYTKNIARIVFAYLFWATIYAIDPNISINHFIGRIIQGPFHFWFLKMLVGIYVVIPILKIITSDRKIEEYFLVLSCITTFIIPMIDITNKWNIESTSLIKNTLETINIKMTLGYTSYFILGHYLSSYSIINHTRKIIYILAILSLICVIIGSIIISNHLNSSDEILFSNFMVFTLLESMAIFIFAKNHLNFSLLNYKNIIIDLSNMSFGIYLVHVFIIRTLDSLGIIASSLNPLFSVLTISMIVFLLSYIIIKVVCYIPLLNRFVI